MFHCRKKGSEGKLVCEVCPLRCELYPFQIGRCHIRRHIGTTVAMQPFGHLTSMAVEPIEKKPFVEFLPRSKTLSVGSYGCNLNCDFCENHEVSQGVMRKGKTYYPYELLKIAKDKGCESICFTYSEPIVIADYLFEVANLFHFHGLKVLANTNGFAHYSLWSDFCKHVDAVNMDWKGSGTFGGRPHTERLLRNLVTAYKHNVHVEISVPLHYPVKDIVPEMEILADVLRRACGSDIPCHLLRIYPAYRRIGLMPLSDGDMRDAQETLLKKNISSVYFFS